MKFIKKILSQIVYKLIEFVEFVEYIGIKHDQDDYSKKIVNSIQTMGLSVMSDTGYVRVDEIHLTQPYDHYEITTDGGFSLIAADNHIVFGENYNEIFITDLSVGDCIYTKDGLRSILSVVHRRNTTSMFDLSVGCANQRYYTNGILSHNTVSSSIFILHTVLFNNDKNVMIVANKGDTAVEIIDKIKSIYTLLPFFLKPGAKIWNQKTLSFDNGCRLKISARSKTPAIGFTIDLLYLDEFAHIPSNIIEPYYTAAFPVTAAVKNSKIIITSTPNGMNLFHTLLSNAERPAGDPLKNNYKALRVYWYQVKGRFVSYIRLNEHKLYNLGITKEEVLEQVTTRFGGITEVTMEYITDTLKYTINVINNDICSEDDVEAMMFVARDGKEYWLSDFSEVTSWKKEAIKDIGSLDAFNQEYDLRFINGSRSLLSESIIEHMLGNKKNYEHRVIYALENRLKFSYESLKWVDDDEIFHHNDRLNVRGVMSIDISEGLGQDYSIINIFKIAKKPDEVIAANISTYTSMSDFFGLVQIGMYRSNLVSVKQLAEVFYTLAFEFFNPDNFKAVLEMNMFGGELLAHLPNLYDGNNNYGSSIFFRYKHRVDADEEKIGLKVGANKNIIVKSYQDAMVARSFTINNEDNVREITTFVKHVTPSGNVRYAGDSGNDDTVMTVVNASTVFARNDYKEIVDDYARVVLDSSLYKKYSDHLNMNTQYVEGNDYSALINVNRRRKLNKANHNYEPKIDWNNKGGI